MFAAPFTFPPLAHVSIAAVLPLDISSIFARAVETAPGLVAACAIALLVPSLALIGWTVLITARFITSWRTRADRRRHRALALATVPPTPTPARLLVEGRAPHEIETLKTLTVIGRDGACDLCLEHASIASHHAAIERTIEDELWLLDLTGPGGAGVRVDGRPVIYHRIAGGERIGIGEIELAVVTAAPQMRTEAIAAA